MGSFERVSFKRRTPGSCLDAGLVPRCDRRVSSPSPDKSSKAAFRPVMTSTSDRRGPVTSVPLPVDQLASVAFMASPAMRLLLCRSRFDPL